MPELLTKLGIDWKLLLSQAVNFLVLLAVLTIFLYKPLLKMMRQRRQKIELGMKGAEEAEKVIAKAEEQKRQKIAAAETEAISIIKTAEQSAQKTKEQFLLEARAKSDAVLKDASEVAARRRLEALSNLLIDARHLVKEAIVKTVSLRPEQVDEKLVEQALSAIKKEKNL